MMPLGMGVGLGPGDFVCHMGTLLPPIYCGQTAGWIKMPLGKEVNLGPGDVVLDGVPTSPLKGAQPPSFQPISIVAKRLDG